MPSPTICTVTGSVITLLGSAVENCVVKVSVITPFFHPTGSLWVSGELGSVTTDSDGGFSIGVIETTTPGGKVTFTFDYYDGVSNRQQKKYSVVIPDQDTASLYDLVAAQTSPVTTPTFPAASVTVSPITNLDATNAQDALEEIQGDIDTINTSLSNKQSTTLTSAHVLVGNGSNIATDVAVTGDIGIDNTGLTSISSGVIVNADVDASAAIAYSKLNLATSIVNADVSASAAIAYSKLALTGSLVDADVSASAGITRSKLATGTNYRILANNSSGVMSENAALTAAGNVYADANGQLATETTVAKVRGGTAQDNSSLTFPSSGTIPAYTPTNHGLLISGSDATATVLAPDASTAKVLISGGASADPSWGTATVSGGGTGVTSNTAYAVLAGGTTSTGAVQSIAPDADTTKVLTSGGTAALPSWQAVPSAPTFPDEAYNVGWSGTASSNTLIGALKQADGSSDPSSGSSAVKVAMRSSTATTASHTQRSITGALSLTLSVYTTLGLTSAVASYIYWYLIDSDGSGTMKVGAASSRYDDGTLVTTMKESDTFTVTIASPGVFTMSGNTLANGDAVILTNSGGALPTGLTAGTTYYVVNNGTDGSGKFRLSALPNGSDINTSGSQSGTHTLHVADGRMTSDGYYSSKAVRCIARTLAAQTTGNWGSPTENSLFPRNTGKHVFVGPTQTSAASTTSATFANFNNRITNTFVPGTSGRYKTFALFPGQGDTASKSYYWRLNNPVGSAVNLATQESVFDTDATMSGHSLPVSVWRIDFLTAGTPYIFELQGAVQTAGNACKVQCADPINDGVTIYTEQMD